MTFIIQQTWDQLKFKYWCYILNMKVLYIVWYPNPEATLPHLEHTNHWWPCVWLLYLWNIHLQYVLFFQWPLLGCICVLSPPGLVNSVRIALASKLRAPRFKFRPCMVGDPVTTNTCGAWPCWKVALSWIWLLINVNKRLFLSFPHLSQTHPPLHAAMHKDQFLKSENVGEIDCI